jgi:hypothetical protein
LDPGALAQPGLELDDVAVEVGDDERVGVGEGGLTRLEEAELFEIDGASPATARVTREIAGLDRHPSTDTRAPGGQSVGE